MVNTTCGAGLSCCQWWRPSFLTCDDLRDTDHHPGPSSGGAGLLEALMSCLSVVQNTLATEARGGTTMAAGFWVADSEQSFGSKALILRSQHSQLSGLRGSTDALTALSPMGVTESSLRSQRSQLHGCHRAIAAFTALSTRWVSRGHRCVHSAFTCGCYRAIAAFTALSTPWVSPGHRCVHSALSSMGVTGPSLRSPRSRLNGFHWR